MKRYVIAVILGGMLVMGCNTESTAKEPWQEALCQNNEAFPAANAPADAASPVQLQFGSACSAGIHKLEGLKFKDAKNAYLCRSFLNRDNPQAEVTGAFGAENIATADILSREGFLGKAFAAVVLTDSADKPDAVIIRKTLLAPLLESIETAEAAAAWVQLSGQLAASPGRNAFCDAAVTETESGWRFDNLENFINCAPTQIVSLEVSKVGHITELSRQDKVNPDGTVTAICVD